jgi:amidase
MLCIADGSDMMGSLRNPAGWNNLYSLRPTSSWMEDTNDEPMNNSVIELEYPISTVGPIALCPDDLVMFLETILPQGQTNFDASMILGCCVENLESILIGWLNDWGGSIPFEDGVLDHCKCGLEIFERGGASIKSFTAAPFSNDDLWESWMAIRSYKIFNSLQEGIGCDADHVIQTLKACGVKPEAIWECEQAVSLTEGQLRRAIEKIHEWSICADKLFETYDFLALPSSQTYPFESSLDWPKSVAGQKMDTYHRWMNVMVPVSILGLPCVTIPCDAGLSRLPMGLSIFAKRGEDAKLLQLARWYHENSDIHIDVPDLAV